MTNKRGVVRFLLGFGTPTDAVDTQVVRFHELDPNLRFLQIPNLVQIGDTVLHRAVRGGYASLVPLLLRAGADRYARNQRGESPLEMAHSAGGKMRIAFESEMSEWNVSILYLLNTSDA